MKFKGRMSASLVLAVTFLGTVSLFYYANQFKKDSVQSLQTKLQTMELQRLEEEKGKQASQVAFDVAEILKQAIGQIQKKAEATADSSYLRQPHKQPPQRQNKERAFLQLVKVEPTWQIASLFDETGAMIAATSSSAPRTISDTSEFKEASKQRMSVLRLQEKKGRELVLQITIPCLTDLGEFLGVFQAEVNLTPLLLDRLPKKTGMFVLLGTPTGRRLTDITLENFPNNLGALIGKNLQEMETYLAQTGSGFFKADWAGVHYLIGSAPTVIPGMMVYSLLEVSSLQKFIGSQSGSSDSFFKDPVILGGLFIILLAGLLITFLMTGGGGAGSDDGALQTLTQEVNEVIQAGMPFNPVAGPEGREWKALSGSINALIQQVSKMAATQSAVVDSTNNEEAKRLSRELENIRNEREQLASQTRELEEQIETLSQQNQQLVQSAQTSAVTAKEDKVAAQAWAEASQIRIEAIVNMSDDLKATLTVIKNYISSILASEEGKITDTQQEFLGVVINKSARLERQINDFLDFSHLETEASQMFLVPTDIDAMLQDVILNVQPQADTKQIRLISDISSHLPKIMLNSDRLGQVFINLVQHALRVTPVGGEVRCSASQLGHEVLIKVVDGGVSLQPEQASLVFLNFHGPDSKVGPLMTGTGLRFPIMKGIIDAHHGTIVARGLSEKGNEMVIKLPLPDEAPAAESPAADLAAVFGAATEEVVAPPPAEETNVVEGTDQVFDLSTFMENSTTDTSSTSQVPGGDDNLDDLLRNIENLNEKTEG